MSEFPTPIRGVFEGFNPDKIPNDYSPSMNNVRPVDVLERKIRLGQRPGLDKWSETQIGGAAQPVVSMIAVSTVVE